MKKIFAIIALMGVFTFGMTQTASAQDESADSAATEQVDSAAVDTAAAPVIEDAEPVESEPVETGMYKDIKTKFIEGSAGFMALVAIALIIGLAFCIERIIYLALSKVNTVKLIEDVENALINKNDLEGAKAIARDTRSLAWMMVQTQWRSQLLLTAQFRLLSSKAVALGSPSSSVWLHLSDSWEL